MEFLVFIIYGVVMSEWIFGRTSKNTTTTITRGHDYYKISGVINIAVSMAGLFLINLFLRGKDIIPE
jgi:hypothetical protein